MKLTTLRLTAFVLSTLLVAACEVPTAPAPVPDPSTPAPIVTPTVNVPAVPTEADLQSLDHGYRLTLSPLWQVQYWAEGADAPPLDSVTGSFETAQTEFEFNEQFDQAVAPFVDLVAQKVDDGSDEISGAKMSLTISTVPRDGLSIQDYLAAASAQVKQLDGAMVSLVGFDDTLRMDRLPTGVLVFEHSEMIHQQLALFNKAADEIILLSFASGSSDSGDSSAGDLSKTEIEEIMGTFLIE